MIWTVERKAVVRERGQLLGADEFGIVVGAVFEGPADGLLPR